MADIFDPDSIFKAYHRDLETGQFRPDGIPCQNCKCEDCVWLPYERVVREVRYLVHGRVYYRAILIWRWTCSRCKKTFRHLPPFLEPYKRFITPVISHIAKRVLVEERMPYEQAVLISKSDNRAIIYNRGDGSSLSASTCWRWIQWMATLLEPYLSENPKSATDMTFSKHETNSHCFNRNQAKSEKRHKNLHLARRVLFEVISGFS